mmetsp:Transcript_22426/g.31576  ORF Transcript_22426/g.31576 Transcript_22426/m.31576 type:complete len:242 (+) Transcript_22426:58-783(+)
MMMMMPSMPTCDPLPPTPYREQSKTRKRFSRNTPENVKESLRRKRNRDAAQDLRDRKKRYEVALQTRLRELNADVDKLTEEEAQLLDEQAILKQKLELAKAGRPVSYQSNEDDVVDSKSWMTTGSRFTAASQQHTLPSPGSESPDSMMGSSIEPAVYNRNFSQQTNSHQVFGALMVPLMCANMSLSSSDYPPLTSSVPSIKMEPSTWQWNMVEEGSDRPMSTSSPLLSFNSLPTQTISSEG